MERLTIDQLMYLRSLLEADLAGANGIRRDLANSILYEIESDLIESGVDPDPARE